MYIYTHHDHLTEEFGDINAKSHACDDLLYCLQVFPWVSLDIRVPQVTPIYMYNVCS